MVAPTDNHVKIDVRAVQALLGRLGADVTALGQRDLGAERLEALDMLVDRAHAAEVAAAGHGDLGIAVLAEQHAEQIVGGAQLALQLVRLEARVLRILDLYRCCVDKADLRAQLAHDLQLQRYVNDLGHIFNTDRAIRQQRRRDDCDRRVFCAGNGYLAVERLAAVDYILCQSTYSSLMPWRGICRVVSPNTVFYVSECVRAILLRGARLNPFAKNLTHIFYHNF